MLVRTGKTRSYEQVLSIGVPHECLDRIYLSSRSFSSLNRNLAKAVLDAGDDVAYLVDGSPSEDQSVAELFRKTRGKLHVIAGVSKTERALSLVGAFGVPCQSVSAYGFSDWKGEFSPLLVYDMDDRMLAGDIKLVLMDKLGEECKGWFISGGKKKKIFLHELDRQKNYDSTTAVYVEKIPLLQKVRFTLGDLDEIMRILRRPDGCPWDRVQTTESIKMNAVEEAYELLDAIEKRDDEKIKEETGDLLMQVVFHALMKEETGAFNLTDVISVLCEKLIFRHTHIFGKDKASSASDALNVWDENKRKEKKQDTYYSAVNDVPPCFPALMQAQKVAKRVDKGGWGYKDGFLGVKKDLLKELAELEEATKSGDENAVKEELGDFLMCAVELGLHAHADAEEALLFAIKKIKTRFEAFERAVLKDEKDVLSLSDGEWQTYYNAAKKAEYESREKGR